MRNFFILAAALLAVTASGAEREINFGDYPVDQTPSNFLSAVGGRGKPGDWKVIEEQTTSAMPARNPNAPALTQHAVVAQLARYAVDDHFPILVLKEDTFNDFTFSTRFKIAGGALAEMAGIVFRYQDEKNYYVLVASVLDSHFWFFKVVDGVRSEKLIGPKVDIAKDEWYEITVQCEGNHIHCLLDRKEIIPMITDSSFSSGKVGFWTKSDTVGYFTDAKLNYTPRETLAQSLVSETVRKFSKLEGLKIFAVKPGGSGPVVIAGMNDKDLGQPGGDVERDVIQNGKSYYGKNKKAGTVTLTVPLRDRNGDAMAAVVFVMKSFPGETEDTAALKSQTMMKSMQPRVTSLEDLLQ
ncbi:MAG TPA: family 16 glycoside hydrolase [Verrucomicrobiae bacterium]|jgi:hypothetical protein|nr:family 16 glycoside hydrolase [Verrucomicrobiae bacterium]